MGKQEKKTARIVGALFIIALVASILGGTLIDAILMGSDTMVHDSAGNTQVITGVLLELINGIAIIGIAVMLFPILKKQSEALALGYVAYRVVEAIISFAAVISPLTLLALSQEYGTADTSGLQAIGASMMAARAQLIGPLLAIVFSIAAFILYYLLYQSVLVPRFISIWGFIGVVLMLAWNLVELFGIEVPAGMLLALPIILNELFLAIWLIVKGFNLPSTAPDSVRPAVGNA